MSDPAQADQVQEIREATDLRKWRIELPNLADDADLTPYEFRLLVHYIRRGKCWESVRTTAEWCNMSDGMVPKARQGLIDKGWVEHLGYTDEGTLIIKPKDRWMENFKKYQGCSCGEQGCSCGEQGCSCGETKKEPIKNLNDKDKEIDARAKKLAELYEENIGAITPLMADIIRNAAIDYPEISWYEPAFQVAVKGNARNWNYVDKVLSGWKRNYFGWKPERNNGRKPKKNQSPQLQADPEELERRREQAAELMQEEIDA